MLTAATEAALGPDGVGGGPPQSMGGEDFSWYLEYVPGALARLGTKTPGGEEYDLHRGDYILDERALGLGIKVLTAAALRTLRDL